MNSKKYKDTFYRMRYINDLRDMVHSSAEMFAEDPAFLVKDAPGTPYRPICYRQFAADVDALGTRLISLGLKDQKVALIGENSYPWVVTYLATANGTGIIVPLDKDLPEQEIQNLIRRAEVGAIVFSAKMQKKVLTALDGIEPAPVKICIGKGDADSDILSLESLMQEGEELLHAGNRDFLDAVIDREAMCALLFTSGTTGQSKGVMLSHKNISANVYNMSKYVKIRRPGGGLSVLPMHHTYELTCHVFTGIYQGMFIAICEGLRYIQQNLKESKATVMLGVPAVFEAMHKKVWKQAETTGAAPKMRAMMKLSQKAKLYNKPAVIKSIFSKIHTSLGGNLALFISGGAAINPQVIRDYEALGIPMIQGYGMTECAPIIAVNRDYYSKADSVGPAMPGTQIKIIDPDEDGVGEIICRGPSVMIGYYNNPEATAEVLKDGWLYTGDYGRLDEEGFLYICGRKKNVIVTKNGKNIFPEEIEELLLEQPVIEEVVVYGSSDKTSGDVIVKAAIYPNLGEIKAALGEAFTEAALENILKEAVEEINDKMPAYKRVKRIKIRETEFEKTTTHKIKRISSAALDEED